jgi:hypothetical protein
VASHEWQLSLTQLRHLSQFNASWCQPGQEDAWLKTLSVGAREALHRMVSKDYECPEEEIKSLYERLVETTQLQYFEKVLRSGEDTSESAGPPDA